MKNLFVLVLILLLSISASSQNSYVFVLVDISKSVQPNDLNQANRALYEVLSGSNLTNASVSAGTTTELGRFKLVPGDFLSISTFGNLQTSLSISPNPVQYAGSTTEITQVLNSIRWIPSDNQTYYTLAKAKIAEYSKIRGINNYKLCIISDNINDDYGPDGKPNYPTPQVQNLAESYNTADNRVNEEGSTKLKFTSGSFFSLTFIPKVDITNFVTPGTKAITPSVTPSITLTSLADGTKNSPKTIKSNSFTISWNCNCPTDTKFTVALTQIEGGNYKDLSKKNILSNSVKFSDIPSGKYKIVVSASNANSAMTYIQIPSNGSGFWIVLLLLLVGGSIGYYFWNKKRQEKIEAYSTDQSEDIFAKGTGTTSNSANTDYF